MPSLDGISFDKLSHAYGKAKDVPALLRDLASSQAKKRAQAIFQLGASICHQGTFYSATPATIPYLVDLLTQPKLKDKHAVLRLLADIATLDDHGRFLLTGLEAKRLPALPRIWTRSLDAVRAGTATYQALLTSRESRVRAQAAFLLAWLDVHAKASAPLVRRALEHEKDPNTRAAMHLSLAYLARYAKTRGDAASHTASLSNANAVVCTAAALALAHLERGKVSSEVVRVLGEGAAKKKLAKTELPWLGGDLSLFATRVLAALLDDHPDAADLLLGVVAAGTSGASFAANVLVRRLFASKKRAPRKKGEEKRAAYVRRDREEDHALEAVSTKLESLDTPQRKFLAALDAHEETFDHDLMSALAERGLPSTPELLQRFLGGGAPPARILDRAVGSNGKPTTVADVIAAAAKASGTIREEHVARLVAALPPDDVLDAALSSIVDLEGEDVPAVALDLAWAVGAKAERALRAAAERLERDGVPKRVTADSKIEFPMCFVAVGIGLAALALAHDTHVDVRVDAYLQRAYGYWPRVRDALAALPVDRRERWVLDGDRDNRSQPAEYFLGAWPYWTTIPTKKVTERVLAHVATWKPKDPWGGKRDKLADPHLVAYIEALRAAGRDTRACESALAELRKRK
jgi:hypothetical protein